MSTLRTASATAARDDVFPPFAGLMRDDVFPPFAGSMRDDVFPPL
jgi:hypothetical protein